MIIWNYNKEQVMNFVLDTYSEFAHTLSLYFRSIVGFKQHSVSFYLGLDFHFLYVTYAYEIGLCSCTKFKRHNGFIDL